MKSNRKTGVAGIVYGVIFIAIAVVVYMLARGVLISKIIAAADLIFGAVLIIIGISDRAKAKKAAQMLGDLEDKPVGAAGFDPQPEPVTVSEPQPAPAASADDGFDDFDDDFDGEITAAPPMGMLPEPSEPDAVARERQLREELRLAEQDARLAGEDADRAEDYAEQCENELIDAQARVRATYGTEQQEALKEVDALTKKAAEASQDAAVAARKARVAERVYLQKKAEHHKAATAAAQAMDDDF